MQGIIASQIMGSSEYVVAVAVGIGLFACAAALMVRKRAFTSGAFGSNGVITIEAEKNVVANAEAMRLLGVEAAAPFSLDNITEAISEEIDWRRDDGNTGSFCAALNCLVTTGQRFRMMSRTTAGSIIAIAGAPAGSRAVLRVREATDEELALAAEIAAHSRMAEQAELLTAALESHEAIALGVSDRGEIFWRSPAFDALPTAVQAQMLAEVNADARPGDGAAANAAIIDMVKDDEHQSLTIEAPDGGALKYQTKWQYLPKGRRLFVAKDVTPNLAAEVSFRRFVNTMSDTFAHLKMSLMIFDDQRRLTLFNPATTDIIGLDAVWLAQRPSLKALLDRLRETRMTPEQSHFIQWRDRILDATSSDAVAQHDDFANAHFEDVWHLANGRTLHILARPHPSGGLAVITDDISDEIALRRQTVSERAVHIATTDVLKEAIVLFAPDGSARLSNGAFRLLWDLPDEASVNGRHVTELRAHCQPLVGEGAFWNSLVDKVTGTRHRGPFEMKLTLLSGKVMLARILPVPDGSVLAVFADITDSERIAAALTDRNEALEQAQEMRAALIDQITHQMRTPLNSIFGFGQLLTREHFGALNAQQTTYVDGIVAASQDLLSAVNGMTEIIDVEDDMGAPVPPDASLDDLMLHVIALVNRRGNDDLVRFIAPDAPLISPPDTPPLQRGHLRQIMFNLITDSITATGDDGANGADVATATIAVDDAAVVIRASRQTDVETGPTLAIGMASRVARLLDGNVTVTVDEAGRHVECRLPRSAILGSGDAAAAIAGSAAEQALQRATHPADVILS